MTSNAHPLGDPGARPASRAPSGAPASRRPRRAEAWRLAGVTAVWATGLFVVDLWISGGGLQTVLGGGATAWTSLGRLAGLVASDLLLLQVLLMARIPLFERAFGHDALTRAHRLTGFWAFWLFFAHIALVVVGDAGANATGPLAELWAMITGFPDMVPAALGTVLLLLVVAVSIRVARRRLRYELWHVLHLGSYAAVLLVLPHQLSTGADFLSSPVATAFWWALWALAVLSVAVFRVLVPLGRSLRHRITVRAVVPDGSRGVTVLLDGHELDRMGTQPGQFFVWRFLDGPGWSAGHPFSISSRPTDSRLTLTARIVGDGTLRLTRLSPGTRVLIEGPYGHLTGERRRGGKLLLIGAGAGVAPLVSLLEGLPYRPGDATLITRDTDPDQALLQDPIATLVQNRGLAHLRLDGRRAHHGSAWLPESSDRRDGAGLLAATVPDLHQRDVYVCGPGPWMDAVRADLDRAGVDPDRVHVEAFDL
ncbi:ferric reductase-like transmembrane domain-containing protein [Schaalia naturae]|uniref:Ferric reductase-like transmembrane domain-containing protein n=1 Tax=Schaalia naturae TaxID=635203 RepID=A0ABW2SKE0_9ACTO